MKIGRTESGFEFSIDEAVLESWELLELVNLVEDEPIRIVRLVDFLLGTDQKQRLIKFLGGRPSVPTMNKMVTEILNEARKDTEVKN